MASVKSLLPPAKSTTTPFHDQGYPRDFGDGGAFPEIHVVQYPLGMGKNKYSKKENNNNNKPRSKTLPITVDADGNVVYDAIVRQKKIVYSQHKDVIPNVLKKKEGEEEEEEEEEETTEETRAAIEKIVNVRLRAAQGCKYNKYEPSSQQSSSAFNSGSKERIIRMVEMAVDPLDPPKFKHKRVPKPSGSPPVPVMHSPPRVVTAKDEQGWRIPPCISSWKNQEGYAIPLDKRLAGDGRGLQEVRINDGFAKLAESLFVAEEKAREALSMRSKVQKEMVMKEKERREEELRALAQKARSEREWEGQRTVERKGKSGCRGRRNERRDAAAMGKKSKVSRDRDRDVSERVALGMASTGGKGGEVMYDERLLNQEKGMGSGFANDDDQYNVYDKGLFTAQPTLSTLYKPKKDTDEETYGNVADEQLDRLRNNTQRFKPDKGFTGATERSGKRERPVEFEKEEEQDPFGLGGFVSEVKRGKKASGGSLM